MEKETVGIKDWLVVKVVSEYFKVKTEDIAGRLNLPVHYIQEGIDNFNLKELDYEHQLRIIRILTDEIVGTSDKSEGV